MSDQYDYLQDLFIDEAKPALYRHSGGGSGGGDTDDWEITDGSYLFYNGARLNCFDELLEKIGALTNATHMFSGCSSLTSLNASNWDTSNATNMSYMFSYCSSLKSLDVSGWDTSNATNMSYMFITCSSLKSLDVSGLDTSNATTIDSIFYGCSALTALDVSKWDTSKVTSMYGIFSGCSSLTSLDVSNWDTSNATNMGNMFNDCSALTALDVSKWDTSKVTSMGNMFTKTTNLSSITGFSATNKAGITIGFPNGRTSQPCALKRLTFRTDLASGKYAIRSAINVRYCSFEIDGLSEMLETITDVSALGLSSSYTSITITGNPAVTGTRADGTTCEVIDDTLRAGFVANGWTLVE